MKKSLFVIFGSAIVLAGCTSLQSKKSTENGTSVTNEQTYSLAEVAKHNSQTDCWLVVDGSVYDVTKFIPQHPGGKEILRGCGKDATTLFTSEREHQAQADMTLEKLRIGKVSG